MNSCGCKNLYLDDEFPLPQDYSHLLKSIAASDLIEVPVRKKYQDVGEEERWYRCPSCRRTWRLVAPDYPFRGVWEEV